MASNAVVDQKRKMGGGKLTVAVLGRAAVGKTAIMYQYLHNMFLNRYMVTVGDKYTKVVEVDGRQMELEILDTPGGYCFEYGRRQAIINADVFVLVYSVEDILSFQKVYQLRDEIIDKRGSDIPVMVVQTKIDLPQRKWFVGCATLEKVIPSAWGYPHLNVSAKNASDMSEIFHEAVRICDGSSKQAKGERRESAIRAILDVLSDQQIWS